MPKAKNSTSKKSVGSKSASAKAKSQPVLQPEPVAEVVLPKTLPGWYRGAAAVGGLVLVGALLLAGFDTVYSGKIFPGTSIAGVYVGGLSQAAAESAVSAQLISYQHQSLAINYGRSTVQVSLGSLALNYNLSQSTQLAMSYGRNGSPWHRLYEQARAVWSHQTNVVAYSYDDAKLSPYLLKIADDTDTPVSDASLTVNEQGTQVSSSSNGTRVDVGELTALVNQQLANLNDNPIAAPIYQLPPAVDTAALNQAKNQATDYLAGPITLTYQGQTNTISTAQLASWLSVSRPLSPDFNATGTVEDFLADYFGTRLPVSVSLDPAQVSAYVANLASQINVAAQNADISMQNGQLAVVSPSRTGYDLNQTQTVADIVKAVQRPAGQRQLTLNVTVTQPAVREDNLASLGITDLISEGETYFPGSPTDRLINVRQGAAKFNDVLVAPGQNFSLGANLGEVDASTGYVPELVIIGNHEEYQYGGGLCQVASTMFRAALLAGLPITERANHSFAISYYQWPYNVPGVDATIYYPEVDLKFTNDTGHYILIQTTMKGVDLKFDFYGTKTKQGVIRGPYFITPPNGQGWNTTVPSKTVFYRDVEDLNGNVTKTDSFYSSYQSSTDFPIISNTKGYN